VEEVSRCQGLIHARQKPLAGAKILPLELVELFRKILGGLNAIRSVINEWRIHLLAFLFQTVNDYLCLPSLPLVESGPVLAKSCGSRGSATKPLLKKA
jgi:hypothetical protein